MTVHACLPGLNPLDMEFLKTKNLDRLYSSIFYLKVCNFWKLYFCHFCQGIYRLCIPTVCETTVYRWYIWQFCIYVVIKIFNLIFNFCDSRLNVQYSQEIHRCIKQFYKQLHVHIRNGNNLGGSKKKLLMVKFKHQILLYQQYQHCTGSSKFKLLLNEFVSFLLLVFHRLNLNCRYHIQSKLRQRWITQVHKVIPYIHQKISNL